MDGGLIDTTISTFMWFINEPKAYSILIGWLVSVGATQLVKRFVYPIVFRRHTDRLPRSTVDGITVVISVVLGFLGVLFLWPEFSRMGFGTAVAVGIWSPLSYLLVIKVGKARGWVWVDAIGATDIMLKRLTIPDEVVDAASEETIAGYAKKGRVRK